MRRGGRGRLKAGDLDVASSIPIYSQHSLAHGHGQVVLLLQSLLSSCFVFPTVVLKKPCNINLPL